MVYRDARFIADMTSHAVKRVDDVQGCGAISSLRTPG